MSQEPWNEEVYSTTVSRKDRLKQGLASTSVLTVLAIIFFIIVLVIGIGAIYLSVGGSKTNSTHEFYNAQNAPAVSSQPVEESSTSDSEEAAEETETSSSTTNLVDSGDGSTLTVQPGEGLGQLASRGGISIADLERLNPEKMATGSWLAHPGDVVRIR